MLGLTSKLEAWGGVVVKAIGLAMDSRDIFCTFFLCCSALSPQDNCSALLTLVLAVSVH